MINLKIISSVPNGACSYYRAYGPLQRIEGVQVHALPDFRWEWLTDTDIVFFERPSTPNYVEAIEICQELGIKTWIDYDDDLLCLPKWNPGFSHYDEKKNRDAIKRAVEIADVVSVATKRIADVYGKFREKEIEVLPNAFNDYFHKWEYRYSEQKRILWRGSNTHRGDIMPYGFAFVQNSKNAKDWTWHFMGAQNNKSGINDLWYITDMMENAVIYPMYDSVRYIKNLRELNPSIYVAPLKFIDFNLAKSNCGWIESTYAGACTLGPLTAEWIKPGITNYSNEDEFNLYLGELIRDESLRREKYEKSFEYIKANLMLSQVNERRETIIKKIVGRKDG